MKPSVQSHKPHSLKTVEPKAQLIPKASALCIVPGPAEPLPPPSAACAWGWDRSQTSAAASEYSPFLAGSGSQDSRSSFIPPRSSPWPHLGPEVEEAGSGV